MIPVSGPSGKLMIVGEYPTATELEHRRAFSGAVGNLFNKNLIPFQRKLSDIYCTYLVKEAIPGFKARTKKERESNWSKVYDSKNWGKILAEEIAYVNPNSVLIFGEKTLNILTGEKKVTQQRGSILHLVPELSDRASDIKVVPTLDPRELFMSNYKEEVILQWDMAKWIRMGDYFKHFDPGGVVWIAKNYESFQNWWQSRGKHASYLTFDIETHYGFVTCISFCADGKEALSVPLLIGKMPIIDRARCFALVREILSSHIPKVNQNIKYDWKVLNNWGFEVRNIVGDTMLMAHTIYAQLPKGLDFLTSIYTDFPYYKDEGKDFDPRQHNYDRLLLYNAKDALVTWVIWRDQQEDAKQQKVFDFFHNKVWPSFFTYRKIDDRGVRIDNERRIHLISKYEELLYNNDLPLRLLAGNREFNPESPKQCGQFLYGEIGIKARFTRSGSGSYATDKTTLDDILKKDKNLTEGQSKIIYKIIGSRQIRTILGFLKTTISLDGRMRMTTKLAGTFTGRTSAGKANEVRYIINEKNKIQIEESGWSFQTIPKHGFDFGLEKLGKDLRTIFVASPGYTFVDLDQSQAEARVVAVLSDDFETLSLFDTTDIHIVTATWVTGKRYEDISKDERQFQGKVTRHAGNLGESAGGLMHRSHKSFQECFKVLEKFHTAAPKVRGVFHAGVRDIINKKRFLISPHGRRTDFFGHVDEDMFKAAYATIPQGTVSDHSKHTILPGLLNTFGSEGAIFPICEAHDGITCEVRNDLVERYIETGLDIVKTPINFSQCSLSRDFDLVIPGEAEFGENWGMMEKFKK